MQRCWMRLMISVLFLAGLLGGTIASAQEAFITETWIKDDPRLSTTIDSPCKRVYIPELLASLSETSGVKLATGERDGSSDDKLVIFLHNSRLADIMNGLWAQLSYQHAEYRWVRTGTQGNYSYRFIRPRSAQELPERLSVLPQTLFERQFHRLSEAAFLSPEVRRDYLYKHIEEIYDGEQRFVEMDLKTERKWQGLRLLGRDSHNSRVLALLRGEIPDLKMTFEQMDPEGQTFLNQIYKESQSTGPQPKYVVISASRRDISFVAPILVMDVDHLGGYGYSGGVSVERMCRKEIRRLWTLEGDETVEALGAQTMQPTPDKSEAILLGSMTRPLDRTLLDMAVRAKTSLIARLPAETTPSQPNLQAVKTLGQAIKKIEDEPAFLLTKQRAGILLVTSPAWFLDRVAEPPYQIMSELRMRALKDGMLDITDMSLAAGVLTQRQTAVLAAEMPEARPLLTFFDLFCLLTHVAPQAKERPASLQVSLTDSALEVLKSNAYFRETFDNTYKGGQAKYFKVIQETGAPDADYDREITFGYVLKDGSWKPVIGGKLRRTHPPK